MSGQVFDALVAELEPMLGRLGRGLDPLEATARLVWSACTEPGDLEAGEVVEARGPVPSARLLLDRPGDAARELSHLVPSTAIDRWMPRLDPERIRRALHGASQLGARLLIPRRAGWPTAVDDLGFGAPHALWLRGDVSGRVLARAGQRGAGIVGSRAATPYGLRATVDLADGLGERGCVVVSGGAYGVDAEAHATALAAGRPTVAVMAGGIDRLYPAGNAALLHRILTDGGAVLAEPLCGTTPSRWRFLQRNRLIAALSRATIVVEAGARSGALNTAAHAGELGRGLGAVPGPISSAASAGCHRLIRERNATLVTSGAEAFELVVGFDAAPSDLELLPAEAAFAPEDRPSAVTESGRVWDALPQRGAIGVEEIATRCGLAPRDVRGALAELDLAGWARASRGGWLRTRPKAT